MPATDRGRTELLSALLVPAARYRLRNYIGVYDLLEVAKAVFVRAATEQLETTGEKQTVNRLTVMTGVPRREVKRLVKESYSPRQYSNLTTRIIDNGTKTPGFRQNLGHPDC